MKKLLFPIILLSLIVLGGCSRMDKTTVEPAAQKQVADKMGVVNKKEKSITVNEIIADSGFLSKNIYDKDSKTVELEKTRGLEFIIPDDYELALETDYLSKKSSSTYVIKILRQKDDKSKLVGMTGFDERNPDKPLIAAIVDSKNLVKNIFVIGGFSSLSGSLGWGDYDKAKISKSLTLKDLNLDGFPEIIIETFKAYTADAETGLITIYFDKEKGIFAPAEETFSTTWKEAYDIVEVNKKPYIIETQSGSGACRVCITPYLVRIYLFTGSSYFDVGSVGVEKEFESGIDALKYALPRVKNRIMKNEIFAW